ncbi:aromatic ring-hydroxylating dioxygenase subunit alpha [Chitinophagales bacterium]|nr:aromatic ring-hydroxylating dioxygenase subunit alpha [Chitinophagales bacterium]
MFTKGLNTNIKSSETLPASFYSNAEIFELAKEKIFANSWQWVGQRRELFTGAEQFVPFEFMDGFIPEPLLLSKGKEESLTCMSNVCTHRGMLLLQHPSASKQLICGYHGRRFDSKGRFKSMPCFDDAENFPRDCEDLHRVPLSEWGGFLFSSLQPSFEWAPIAAKLDERVGFLDMEKFRFSAKDSKEYHVHSHWALYCDNYLEGFHIPFVHKELNQLLDGDSYETQCFPHGSLQIGYSANDAERFELPEGHPDFGKNVTAYYYWIYPNLMLNFYPWGLSVNVVKPVSVNRTRVQFLTFIADEEKWERMSGAYLTDKVEREDEFVVEAVHKGLQSRFYPGGRFSPSKEQGVHHFQLMLKAALED